MMLKAMGVWYFSPQSGVYGGSGIPDRIVCASGQFIGIEAKSNESHKPTALQAHCMASIERVGGKCFVVYDEESIAVVETFLKTNRKTAYNANS